MTSQFPATQKKESSIRRRGYPRMNESGGHIGLMVQQIYKEKYCENIVSACVPADSAPEMRRLRNSTLTFIQGEQ